MQSNNFNMYKLFQHIEVIILNFKSHVNKTDDTGDFNLNIKRKKMFVSERKLI